MDGVGVWGVGWVVCKRLVSGWRWFLIQVLAGCLMAYYVRWLYTVQF